MSMLRRAFLAAAALTLSAPALASPLPNHAYDLNGNTADALGGPSLSLQGSATQTASGVSFANSGGSHSGLALTDAVDAFSSGGTYSLELEFEYASNASWYRVLNMLGTPTGEQGLYVRAGGLSYYEDTTYTGAGAFTNDTMHHLVFTRDETTASVYLDGVAAFSHMPPYASSLITNDILFFIDNGDEESSGFVDFIRTYDIALSSLDVSTLYNNGTPLSTEDLLNSQEHGNGPGGTQPVPEPATWMLSILGFGVIGAAMRTGRRERPAVAA